MPCLFYDWVEGVYGHCVNTGVWGGAHVYRVPSYEPTVCMYAVTSDYYMNVPQCKSQHVLGIIMLTIIKGTVSQEIQVAIAIYQLKALFKGCCHIS